jgi:hypothetical protein
MTRTELLSKVINARLAVSGVLGAIEPNPILSVLRDSEGTLWVHRLQNTHRHLIELETDLMLKIAQE